MGIEVYSLIKDLVLSGAAITGAIVAVKGLNTWKRQQKWQYEYELSRRILVTLFKYRDAINVVRHPAIWAYEMESPPEEEKKSSEYINYYGVSKAYQARWTKVQSERTVLYADLLEAEAIWDSELKDLFKKIFDLEHELHNCVRRYIRLINPDTREESKSAIMKIAQKKRDIMYDDLSEEPDEYKKDFISAAEKIEQYLKPKLKHK